MLGSRTIVADPTTNTLPSGSPARWAALLGVMLGVAMVLFGVWLMTTTLPLPLSGAFIIGGLIESTTSWFSLRAVRSAWAFACSLNGTLFLLFLFGAPNLRDRADVAMGIALLPAFAFGVLALLYALSSDDY